MTWHVEHAIEPSHAPSRSTSYSCAMSRMLSPSFASTDLSRLPLESLKWTLILREEGEQTNELERLAHGRTANQHIPRPGCWSVYATVPSRCSQVEETDDSLRLYIAHHSGRNLPAVECSPRLSPMHSRAAYEGDDEPCTNNLRLRKRTALEVEFDAKFLWLCRADANRAPSFRFITTTLKVLIFSFSKIEGSKDK